MARQGAPGRPERASGGGADRPSGAIVTIAGPDGVGKSMVADALAVAAREAGQEVDRYHWRPELLPRPADLRRGRGPKGDASDPHAAPPHHRLLSLALLVYYWLDFVLGHALVLSRARRSGALVVVERGWLDMAVDPRRYRLDLPDGLVAALGRLVPSPDLLVILEGDPALVHARKPELPVAELARQRRRWRQLATGSEALRLDAAAPCEDTVRSIRARLGHGRVAPGWVGLPRPSEPRLRVPAASPVATREGLRLYQPSARVARLAMSVARGAAHISLFRALPRSDGGPPDVQELLGPHVPAGGTYALLRTNHPGRYVARILDRGGRPVAHVKLVTEAGDAAPLAREAEALTTLAPSLTQPVRAPRLLGWDGRVLLTEPLTVTGRRDPQKLPVEVAASLGSLWRATAAAHGDAAPWNLLTIRSGWALVDWEHAAPDQRGFRDVLHFVVQAYARLGTPSRREVVAGLDGRTGWVGRALRAYADAAGLPLSDAPAELVRCLREPSEVLVPGPDGSVEGHARRQALLAVLE